MESIERDVRRWLLRLGRHGRTVTHPKPIAKPIDPAVREQRLTWLGWALTGISFLFLLLAMQSFGRGPETFRDGVLYGALAIGAVLFAERRTAAQAPALAWPDHTVVTVLAIAGFALTLRLLDLDRLPSEMWGDANEHFILAQLAQTGRLTLAYHFGGDGPLYSYLVALVANVMGLSFYGLKFTSALIGVALTIATYLFAKTLFDDDWLAYSAGFISAVSFWTLSWSRQPKPHLLVPLFIALALVVALRGRPVLGGIILGLGFYSQAGYWGAFFLPIPLLLTFGIMALRGSTRGAELLRDTSLFCLAALICALPILPNIAAQFSEQTYISEKLGPGSGFQIGDVLERLGSNLVKNIQSVNFSGDTSFRHNVPGLPHLDTLSGVLFWLGLAAIVYKIARERNWKLLLLFVLPLFTLQIPSVMDLQNPQSLPNMGRMIGILPFAYIAVAYGLTLLRDISPNRLIGAAVLALGLCAITYANSQAFFTRFPLALTHNSTPVARTVADIIGFDYPVGTNFIMLGCCWQGSQPEPKSVQFVLPPAHRDNLREIPPDPNRLNCQVLQGATRGDNVVLILSPQPQVNGPQLQRFEGCFERRNTQLVRRSGVDIALIVDGQVRR